MKLINKDSCMSGIYKAKLIQDENVVRAYIPGVSNIKHITDKIEDTNVVVLDTNEVDINDEKNKSILYEKNIKSLPIVQWCAYNTQSTELQNLSDPAWVMFEAGDVKRPVVLSYDVIGGGGGIGGTSGSGGMYGSPITSEQFITTDVKLLPKLTIDQIEKVLTDSYFGTYSNSRLNVSDKRKLAEELYAVQNKQDVTILVPLAICAQETGWATSLRSQSAPNHNLWNFGCSSTAGDWGHYFDNAGTVSNAFDIFYNQFLRQYYYEGNDTVKANGGPWKTLKEIGETYCPSPSGWAEAIGDRAVDILKFIPQELFATSGSGSVSNSGCPAATVYSLSSDGEKQLSANFKVKDFACKDGSDKILIVSELVQVLEQLKSKCNNASITINSGYRNESYNKSINGAKNSMHCKGAAADIVIANYTPTKVAKIFRELKPSSGGCGIYSGFTHVDVRYSKADW